MATMSSFMQDTRDPDEDLCLLELLGEGSYGAVYRAERRTDYLEVAVKIIPADNPVDLLKEVDIMLACASPYIVRLHDCYYKDNEAWLVMDYVGGGSVSDILEACDVTLSEAEARECTAWTILALDYLHSNRKLHRDVKAGNILLTSDGRAKLADFGVSKERELNDVVGLGTNEQASCFEGDVPLILPPVVWAYRACEAGDLPVNTMANKAQTAIGTPYWMAPEVIQEVPYDGQADIWSMAITCIEMVEGKPPLHNVHPMRAIFMIPSKPSPRLSEPAKWSLEFNDFLARCLEKKPEDRPSSRALLGHPWIASSVQAIQSHDGAHGSMIIGDLVSRHLPMLQSFREDASEAKANQIGDESEDITSNKTATIRRLSLLGSGATNDRGHATPDATSPRMSSGEPSPNGSERGRPMLTGLDHEWAGGSAREGSYSSCDSVIRIPMDAGAGGEANPGDNADTESVCTGDNSDCDGESSTGSVVRLAADEEGSDATDDDSSDGSVVRLPNDCYSHENETAIEAPARKNGAESPRQFTRKAGANVNRQTSVRFAPAPGDEQLSSRRSNLESAMKYFVREDGPGAMGSRDAGTSARTMATATEIGVRINGTKPSSGTTEKNAEVKAILLAELDRLEVDFANSLAKLRNEYDVRKAALQAQLRACADK